MLHHWVKQAERSGRPIAIRTTAPSVAIANGEGFITVALPTNPAEGMALCRSLRAGQRAATIMNLIQSAELNGHDPYRYLMDVLERPPTQPASRLEELLPHSWHQVPTIDR